MLEAAPMLSLHRSCSPGRVPSRLSAAIGRSARVLAAACSLAACSTDADRAPATASAEPAGDGRAIAVACSTDDAIAAPERGALEERARALYQALREGQRDALWDELHPQARREDQREPFLEALASMEGRLEGTLGKPAIERIHLVDLRGGKNGLARVQCGSDDDPERFSLLVNAGDEDVAVVVLRATQGPRAPLGAGPGAGTSGATAQAITVQLRRRGERWYLLGIQVNPTAYRGRDAAAYEALADDAMRRSRVVLGYVLLGLAQTLSDRGASITSATHERIEQKLAAIARDELLLAELGTWTLGDARFRIEGISLVATRQDVSPVLKYVSPQGLVEELLDRDADALVAEVRRRFPDLEGYFDAVVLEAYAQPPSEAGASYQAYRLVRSLAAAPSPT